MKNFNFISRLMITLLSVALVACISSFVMLCIYGINSKLFTFNSDKVEETMLSSAQLERTFDYGNSYLKGIVFVSDKSMASISTRDEISKDQVWTTKDNSLPLDYNLATTSIIHSDGEKGSSIADAIELYKPQYVIITVGIENGVGHCTEEKFKEYYTRLIDSILDKSPDTRIILQSVFPVSKSAEKNDPSISNERIDQANKFIASLAEELAVRYLDTASVLKGEDGRLDPKYDSGNGISLNSDGYGAVLEYIKTHGYK